MNYLLQDIHYSLRILRRAPAFTAIAVTTLALGIGANASVFSIIDRALIRTPSGVKDVGNVKRMEQRYSVALTRDVRIRDVFSFPEVEAIAGSAAPDLVTAAYSVGRTSTRVAQVTQDLSTVSVVGDYFGVLGITPIVGRVFAPEERGSGAPSRLAVISYNLWSNLFGKSRDVIGKSIALEGETFQIIGVVHKGFRGVSLAENDLWIPFNALGDSFDRVGRYSKPYDLRLKVIAHLSARGGGGFIEIAAMRLRSFNVVHDSAATIGLTPIAERLDSQTRSGRLTTMGSLFGAVVVLFVVACANVGNLLAMRSWQRRRDIAIRVALGVSPTRLAAQAIIESFTLALLAATVALLIAFWTGGALRNALVPEMNADASVVDLRVVIAASVFAVLAAALTGAVSMFRVRRLDIWNALRATEPVTGRGLPGSRRSALLIQTALSTVLLAAAGLFVQSFRHIINKDIGYKYDNISLVTVPLSVVLSGGGDAKGTLEEAAARIERIPGIDAVALAFPSPLQALGSTPLFLPDRDSVPTVNNTLTAVSVVTPGFMRVLGLQVTQGRRFMAADGPASEPVVMVSAQMAKLYWPGETAIGKCLILQQRAAVCRRVIGVVEDVHAMAIVEGPSLRFYIPFAQAPPALASPQALIIRTQRDRGSKTLPLIRQTLDVVGRGKMWDFKQFGDLLDAELHPWRLSALLFAGLGALALVIAGVGIYGTVAYATTQRTREIGVRRALGADHLHIVSLVGFQALAPVVAGAALGLGLAAVFGRVAKAMLYEVAPTDPIVLAAAGGVLVMTALVACVIPARRALRVDPVIALASE
jgi:predicted permease